MNAWHGFDDLTEAVSLMDHPLDSRQLKAFGTLARTGSFTLAGKELHLSQSAVSHSMKALEGDVGCRLLDKVGKKVLLTQAGEQLLIHAERILAEMSAARVALTQLGKWGRGRLRIGASTTACQYILPAVLREFQQRYPQSLITIEPGDALEAIELLHQNRIDLGLTLEPQREEQFDFQPLFMDELAFLVGPLHPWARQGSVNREDISRQNYILYNKASYTFRLIEDYFREENMVLNTVIDLGSMEAIKELVKVGLGVSILAPWIARKEIEEGSLVSLSVGRRKMKRQWGIVHWRGRRLSLAEETFINLCRVVTRSLGSDPGAKTDSSGKI